MSATIILRTFGEASDAELLAAYRNGEKAALDALCQRHWGKVRGYFINHLRPSLRDEADDLTQSVFEYFVEQALRLPSDIPVLHILYAKAFRLLSNHLRDRKRLRRDCTRVVRLANMPAEEAEALLASQREVRQNAARLDLAALLGRLTPVEAEAVRMFDIEEHTAKSAAEKLGIEQSSFEWRYRKARKRLQDIAAEEQ